MVTSIFRMIAAKPSIQKVLRIGKCAFSPKYLLFTNIMISGNLAAFGDGIQQTYQHSKADNVQSWDVKRTASMFGAGVCLTPYVHYWYFYLDKFLPGTSVRIVLTKMIPDLFLFSPSYIMLFLVFTGALEGQTWQCFKTDTKDKFMGFFSIELFLWTPAQFFNFYFLPTRFRVLYDNTISLIADVLYSYVRFDYKYKPYEDDVYLGKNKKLKD